MKTLLFVAAGSVSCTIPIYLLAAFIEWSMLPGEWSAQGRAIAAAMQALAILAFCGIAVEGRRG